MRKKISLSLFTGFLFCVACFPLAAIGQDGRAPFALELTELNTSKIRNAEFFIARTDITVVRFWILAPYSDTMDWLSITPTINGRSASRICNDMRSSEGKYMQCDLKQLAQFKLNADRNVFEIKGKDRNGKEYFASFVLLTDPKRVVGGGSVEEGIRVEQIPVAKGADRVCPEIKLLTPLAELASNRDILLRGTAQDNASPITLITINGQPVYQSTGDGKGRGLGLEGDKTSISSQGREVTFEKIIAAGTPSIVIQVKDSAGNLTQYTLPITSVQGSNELIFSGRRYAVVIGVSDYKFNDAGLTDLDFADDDAKSFYDFLVDTKGGGFSSDDVLLMMNEQATLSGVRSSLDRFLTKAEPTDLVYFFLAGHGTPDPYAPQNLYFLLHDSKVADMKNTALNMDELRRIINTRLRAKRMVFFLDTCHSAGVSDKGLVSIPDEKKRDITISSSKNIVNQYAVSQLYNREGRSVLTSSDVSETSGESKKWGGGHGVFTFALMEGLKGEADSNNDKVVTVEELFIYVRDKVRLETAGKQNPQALSGSNSSLELAKVK